MTLYRLYTEHYASLPSLVQAAGFEGFTILNGVGYWRGAAESCAIIEILAGAESADQIAELAESIRRENNQEAVILITESVGFSIHERKG